VRRREVSFKEAPCFHAGAEDVQVTSLTWNKKLITIKVIGWLTAP